MNLFQDPFLSCTLVRRQQKLLDLDTGTRHLLHMVTIVLFGTADEAWITNILYSFPALLFTNIKKQDYQFLA